MGGILSAEDRAYFLGPMRRQTNSAVHRQMNVLLLLDDDFSAEQIAQVLYIDVSTVREHLALYRETGCQGVVSLAYDGSRPVLTKE